MSPSVTSKARRIVAGAVAVAAVGAMTAVVPTPASATFPGVNGRILFTEYVGEDDAQTAQIFSANPDGSQVQALSDGTSYDQNPAPNAANTKIAFTRQIEPGVEENLWVMDADGANPTKIVDSDSLDREVTWSPDGTQLAFTSNRNGPYEIFVADADGSNQVKVADGQDPSWAPDGTRIAFADGSANELRTIAPDGSDPVLVSAEPSSPYPIDWSPDSDRLVYSCTLPDVGNAQCLIDPDGANRVALDIGSLAANGAVYSPDGTKLLFEGSTADDTGNGLYVMDVDGTDVAQILAADENFLLLPAWGSLPLLVDPPVTTSTTPGSTVPPSPSPSPTDPSPAPPAAPISGRPAFTG